MPSTKSVYRLVVLTAAFSLILLLQYSSDLMHVSSSSAALDTKNTLLNLREGGNQNSGDEMDSEGPYLGSNLTTEPRWKSIQETPAGGIHFFHRRIDNIRILAERHSGSSYMTRYLRSCFPDHPVEDFLVRKKHWFQPTPATVVDVAQRVDKTTLSELTDREKFDSEYKNWWDIADAPDPKGIFRSSLVLVLVRDPYQWLEAMRRGPWHWPNHLEIVPKNETTIATMRYNPEKENNRGGRRQRRRLQRRTRLGERSGSVQIQKSFVDYVTLDWSEFVERPMKLLDENVALANSIPIICRNGYPRGTLSPCLQNHSYIPPKVRHIPRSFLRHLPFAVNDVVYELHSEGRPFNHPLALRAAKLRNMLELVQVWDLGGFAVVKYEDVLGGRNNYTALSALVHEIGNALGGVTNKCPPHKILPKEPYNLSQNFSEWINSHTDWDIENVAGYTRTGA